MVRNVAYILVKNRGLETKTITNNKKSRRRSTLFLLQFICLLAVLVLYIFLAIEWQRKPKFRSDLSSNISSFSPTPALTPTISLVSPTPSISFSCSASHSESLSFSTSPTESVLTSSKSLAPYSFTDSASASTSASWTPTASFSYSPSISFTPSISNSLTNTHSISPSISPSTSSSPSPSPSFSPQCEAILEPSYDSRGPCRCFSVELNITEQMDLVCNYSSSTEIMLDLEYSFLGTQTSDLYLSIQHKASIYLLTLASMSCPTGITLDPVPVSHRSMTGCLSRSLFKITEECLFSSISVDGNASTEILEPKFESFDLDLEGLYLEVEERNELDTEQEVPICYTLPGNWTLNMSLAFFLPLLEGDISTFVSAYHVERSTSGYNTHNIYLWVASQNESVLQAINTNTSPAISSQDVTSANSTVVLNLEKIIHPDRVCSMNNNPCFESFLVVWVTSLCSFSEPVDIRLDFQQTYFNNTHLVYGNHTLNLVLPAQTKCQLVLDTEDDLALQFPLYRLASGDLGEDGIHSLELLASDSLDTQSLESLDLESFWTGSIFSLCWGVVSPALGVGSIVWGTIIVEALDSSTNLAHESVFIPNVQELIFVNGQDFLCTQHGFPKINNEAASYIRYTFFVRVQFDLELLFLYNVNISFVNAENANPFGTAEMFQYISPAVPKDSDDKEELKGPTEEKKGLDLIRHHMLENIEWVVWLFVFSLFCFCLQKSANTDRKKEILSDKTMQTKNKPLSHLGEMDQQQFLAQYEKKLQQKL